VSFMEETIQQVKRLVDAKNLDGAKRYVEGIRRHLGETPEFRQREQELNGLLGL